MASRLQDVILRGLDAARPLATAVAPGTLYYSTDLQTTARSSGTTWETYSDTGGAGGGPHAPTHSDGSTDPVDVTDLAGYPGTTATFLRGDATFTTVPGAGIHATTHEPGGVDPMAVDAAAATGSLRTIGTGPLQATAGNDARLSNSRTPTAHASTHSSAASDPVTVTALAGYPGGTANFLRADATFAAPPAGGGAHATTHSSGGADPVTVTNLAGYPGGTASFLRADATFAAPPTGGTPAAHAASHYYFGTDAVSILALFGFTGINQDVLRGDRTFSALPARVGTITMIIDGGSSVITTGIKGYIEVPFACTIQAATLLADVSGSIVVDIWKDTYANYPPVVGDTITASAKPTISSAIKNQDTTLTGWTTTINAGDILGFNVNSVTTITKVTLSLKVQAT